MWSEESVALAEIELLERRISYWSKESVSGAEKQMLERITSCWSE
jgi:hypothetical protein